MPKVDCHTMVKITNNHSGIGLESIVNLVELASSAFITNHSYSDKNKYEDLYLLFLTIKALIKKCDLVQKHYLTVPFDEPYLQNSGFGSSVQKWLFFINKDFESLSSVVPPFINQIGQCLNTIPVDEPQLEETLEACFRGKIPWTVEFIESFDAGTVTTDGNTLISRALTIHELNQTDFDANLVESELDISDLSKRLALKRCICEDIVRINKCLDRIRVFIQENVSMEQLL